IAIKSSDKPDVIGVNGQITPQAADTEVTLVLTVTRTSDGSMADTAELKVTVPAKSTIEPTASEVAAGITALTPPLKDVTLLTLPAVPEGFSVAIKDSDKPDVIGLSGQITPQAADTEVMLVLTVTRTSDGSTADMSGLKVTVPAMTAAEPTAANIAGAITILAAPEVDATLLTLPVVPEGYSLSIKSVDNPGVIGLGGQIAPPSADTEVTLVLTVTKTSDGSTADTAGLKVIV
ncbi:S-layer protein, partial [Paenibacillus sepulcri]|nr:S-layer protein [Paenibacillus sepulcri]